MISKEAYPGTGNTDEKLYENKGGVTVRWIRVKAFFCSMKGLNVGTSRNNCIRLVLDEYDDSISRRRKLRIMRLEILEKHLYTYLDESRENLSSRGGSQDSAKRMFNGVDCRKPRAILIIRNCWR